MAAAKLAAIILALSASGGTGFTLMNNATRLMSQGAVDHSFAVSAMGGRGPDDCHGMKDPRFWAKKSKLDELLRSTKGQVYIKDGAVKVQKVPFMACGEESYKKWCEGKSRNPDCSKMNDDRIPRKTLTALCAKTVGIDMDDEGPPLVATLKQILEVLEVTKIQVTGLAGLNQRTGKMVAATEEKVREAGWLNLAKARAKALERQLGVTADTALSAIGKPSAMIKIKASDSSDDLRYFENTDTRQDCIKEICGELTMNLQGLVSVYESKRMYWIDEADMWKARYDEIKIHWLEADERTKEAEELLIVCQGQATTNSEFELINTQRDALKWKVALAKQKCSSEKEALREECDEEITKVEDETNDDVEKMVKEIEKERLALRYSIKTYQESITGIVAQSRLLKVTTDEMKKERDRLVVIIKEKEETIQSITSTDRNREETAAFDRALLLKLQEQIRALKKRYDEYVETKERELEVYIEQKDKVLVDLREECDEAKEGWSKKVSVYLLEKTTLKTKINEMEDKVKLLLASVKHCEDDVEDCESEKEVCEDMVKDCPPTPPAPPDEGGEDGGTGEDGTGEDGGEGGEGDDEDGDDEEGGDGGPGGDPTPTPPGGKDIIEPPEGAKVCHVGGGWIYCMTDGDCPDNTKDALTCREYGARYTTCHKVCDCVEVDNNRAGNSRGQRYTQTSNDPNRKVFKSFLRSHGVTMKECMPALKTTEFKMPEPEVSGSMTNQMYRRDMKRQSKTQRKQCTEVINGFIVHVNC